MLSLTVTLVSLLVKTVFKILVDENTVNTWMQCGAEAQKETIRLMDIGAHYLVLYLIVTLVRSLFRVVFDCYIFLLRLVLYLSVTLVCSLFSVVLLPAICHLMLH